MERVVTPIGIIPGIPGRVTISGKDGDDAKRYQENLVDDAVNYVKGKK